MDTVTTPNGKIVKVETNMYGTRNQGGTIYYGGIKVAYWTEVTNCTGVCHNLESALKVADEYIDKYRINDETTSMSIRDIPESLRLMFRGKALQEGKTMQTKIIELMQEYINQ